MKLQLVTYWRDAWKFWSVKLAALGTALVTFATLFPDAALQAWFALPDEFKQVIPPSYVQGFGVVLMALSLIARIIKQQKLQDELLAQGKIVQTPSKPEDGARDERPPLAILATIYLGIALLTYGLAAQAAVNVNYVYEVYIKRGGTTQFPSYRSSDEAAAKLACRNAIAQKAANETVDVTYTCTSPQLLGIVDYTATPTTLPAPVNFTGVLSSTNPSTQISLGWSAVSGAAAYDIERCQSATCTNFTRLSCYVGVNRAVGSLTPGTTYRFRIRASRDTACSATAGNLGSWSSIVNVTTQASVAFIAVLNWTYSDPGDQDGVPVERLIPDAEGFRIVYGNSRDAANNPIFDRTIDIPNPVARTYIVENLTPGTWHFAVKTYGGGNESVPSVTQFKTIS